MSELSTLGDLLGQLGGLITNDRNLTAKAFGILLLGRKIDDKNGKENMDPTDILLSGRIRHPNL